MGAGLEALLPLAKAFEVGGGAVAEPAVELGLVFELLAAGAGDDEEAAVGFGQGGHVAPQFFELGHGENILLAMAPAFFDFLEGDVAGHAMAEFADGGLDAGGVCQISTGEAEQREELVEVNPGGHGVVVGEGEFILLAGHGEAFDKPGAAIDPGEAPAAILNAPGDDFKGEAGLFANMEAEQGGVDVRSQGIDIVQEEVFEIRTLAEKLEEHAVPEQIGDFEPMTDRMDALGREVVGVVAPFAAAACPLNESGMKAGADLLLLFIEHLLRHFLPGKAEVAHHGDEAEADAAAGREQHRAGILVVRGLLQVIRNGIMGEIAGGEDVRDWGSGELADAAAFGEVHFDEGAVTPGKLAEGMKGFDDPGPLGPAAAYTGGKGDYRHLAVAECLKTAFAIIAESGAGNIDDFGGGDILNGGAGRQSILGKTDPAAAKVGADLFMKGGIKPSFIQDDRERFSLISPLSRGWKEAVKKHLDHAAEFGAFPAGRPEAIEFVAFEGAELPGIGPKKARHDHGVITGGEERL